LSVAWLPVVDLEDRRVVAYEAADETSGIRGCDADAQRVLLATDCRLTAWIRRLQRAVAVEEASQLPGDVFLLVSVDPSEIGDGGLLDSLEDLRERLPAGQRMVAAVPEETFSDVPYARQFRARLGESGIALACNGSPAGAAPLLARKELCPEFFRLPATVIDGIARSHQRQRQLRDLADAARAAGCTLIAAGLTTREDAELCRELGCSLGQGELFVEV
jgi:EAL domain-containing protein (putative c-di-GMP-specific phosphodiesterase class I)